MERPARRASAGLGLDSLAHPLASLPSTLGSTGRGPQLRDLPAPWSRPLASSTCASQPATLPGTCSTHLLAPPTCTQDYRPSQLPCSPSPSTC